MSVIDLADENMVELDYWHTQVNSQLEVRFEYKDGAFQLRRFVIFDDILDSWDETEASCFIRVLISAFVAIKEVTHEQSAAIRVWSTQKEAQCPQSVLCQMQNAVLNR